MLAQSFKSAIDLDISEAQKDALCKVLTLLETGKLTLLPFDSNTVTDSGKFEFTGHFNMATFGTKHTCGTAACIAGTAQLISGVKFIGVHRTDALENLFYATDLDNHPKCMETITPAEAAIALRSYLTTGHARWDLAVA